MGLRLLRWFERVAIVTDLGWIRESARLLGALECDQLDRAIAWASAGTGDESVWRGPARHAIMLHVHSSLLNVVLND